MLMLLEITPDQFESMSSTVRLNLLEGIVASSIAGNHKFVIPDEVTIWAENRMELPVGVRSHLVSLEESNIFLDFEQDRIDHVHLVIQSGSHGISHENHYRWTIGHIELMKGSYLKPTKLLVENKESDGELYDLIFKSLSIRILGSLENLSYEIEGGETDGIAPKFVQLIGKKNIICCICDSDRLSPQFELIGTFVGIKNKIRMKNYIGKFESTPCHEVENFLSIDIVDWLVQKDGNSDKIKLVSKIKKLIEKQSDANSLDCLWLFIDIKRGIVGTEIKSEYLTESVQEWLCKKYQKSSVSDITIEGIGESILENFLRSDRAKGMFHKHMRSRYWKKHFSQWFEEFIWYFYGQEPLEFENDLSNLNS